METRSLYALTTAFVVVVGVFYYYSGQSEQLKTSKNANLYSSAEKVSVIQTNQHGQLYLQAHVKSLQQTAQNEDTLLQDIQGTLYAENSPSIVFIAKNARADTDYQQVSLNNGVEMTKLGDKNSPPLAFSTEWLQADTQKNQIFTQATVRVHSPQAEFTSQGLTADLNLGQYQFFKIRAHYERIQK